MNTLKTWFVVLTLICGSIVTMALEPGPLPVMAAPIQHGDPEDPMLPDLVPVILSCGPPVQVKITNQGSRSSVPSFTHIRVKQTSGQGIREQVFQTARLAPGQSQEHSLPLEASMCKWFTPTASAIPGCGASVKADMSNVIRESSEGNNQVGKNCIYGFSPPQ